MTARGAALHKEQLTPGLLKWMGVRVSPRPCYDAGYYSYACDAAFKCEAAVVADGSDEALEIRRRTLGILEATAAMDCRAP